MSLAKSFVFSFIAFIVLNFIMNLLIIVAKGTLGTYFSNIEMFPLTFIASFFAVSNIGVMPPGYGIFLGINTGISWLNSNIFVGILIIIASFLPGLIASVLAGKMANTVKQSIVGIILTMILSSIILIIIYLVNSLQIYSFIIFLKSLTQINIPVFIFIFGIFNGIFWASIAAMINKEDKV